MKHRERERHQPRAPRGFYVADPILRLHRVRAQRDARREGREQVRADECIGIHDDDRIWRVLAREQTVKRHLERVPLSALDGIGALPDGHLLASGEFEQGVVCCWTEIAR